MRIQDTSTKALQNFKNTPQNAPQFGSTILQNGMKQLAKPGIFLKTFDFIQLGDSVLAQSKFIYGGLCISRSVCARSQNERWESLRRDPFAWYSWFYGKPLLEWALITFSTAADPLVRHILRRPIPEMGHPFNPTSQVFQTTERQLKERLLQLQKRMSVAKVPLLAIRQMENTFTRASNLLLITSSIGMLFTIFSLGIGINLLNIAATRRNILLEKMKYLAEYAYRDKLSST